VVNRPLLQFGNRSLCLLLLYCFDEQSSVSVCYFFTLAPPSTSCSAPFYTAVLYNNQFIYSTSELYAAGMLNNQFGVYVAYTNGNVTSTSLWLCPQSSTPAGAYFAAQSDRNLVVYTSTGGVLWAANIYISGLNTAFCLTMENSGNLVWADTSGNIIWQTNTSG
jgi:hypothetical protein